MLANVSPQTASNHLKTLVNARLLKVSPMGRNKFYRLSDEWNAEQRDCAGLVRFAWREALRRHDRAWFQKMGEGYEAWTPDVRAYSLERNPLGEKLFQAERCVCGGRARVADGGCAPGNQSRRNRRADRALAEGRPPKRGRSGGQARSDH